MKSKLISFNNFRKKYNIRNIDLLWLFLWAILLINIPFTYVWIEEIATKNELGELNANCKIISIKEHFKVDAECRTIRWRAKLSDYNIYWLTRWDRYDESSLDFIIWQNVKVLIWNWYWAKELSIWIKVDWEYKDLWQTLLELWIANSNKQNKNYDYYDFIEKQRKNAKAIEDWLAR